MMKLEDQVCSLELAKRLKELGVPQESMYMHTCLSEHLTLIMHSMNVHPSHKLGSAFTVAELGKLLPSDIVINGEYWWPQISCDWLLYYVNDNKKEMWADVYDEETEANARAKMLIYLIENDIIKI